MKNQFNDLLMLFVVSFLVFAFFERATAVTVQKSSVLKPSSSASAVEPDQGKKPPAKISESRHLQKGQTSTSGGDQGQSAKTQNGNIPSYSFRPLLIQGKKRLVQKTKDMKVESGNIVESQLFFVDIDFKKRIFEAEDISSK